MKDRYQNFTLLISSIYRSIYKIKDKEMAVLDLKGTHVTCLYYLYHYGEQTAAYLCKISGEDKAAISRSVEYLEQAGYISPGGKAYRRALSLTQKGVETAKFISYKVEEAILSASKGISEDQRQALYKALGIIEYNLNILAEKEG